MSSMRERIVKIAKSVVAIQEPDVRIYYLGGGSYVVQLSQQNSKELQSAFPRSFRRGRADNNGRASFYVTEKASKLARIWCEEHNLSIGSSPMWDLEPGEMPSW